MWHNISIVDLHPTHNILLSIIGVMVDGVTVFVRHSSVLKWPRVSLCAPALLVITGGPWVVASTGSMNHNLLDYFEKLRLRLRVWPVCADTRINGVNGVEFVFVLKKDEQVHVWESPLLEFDSVDFCNGSAEYTILHDVMEEGISFQSKYLSNEFRVVRGFLSRK